jgi:PTH1 family peptidyl-tRNA hydrolase
VVVDDFNLPLGAIRLRKQGSDGGHNGLKSVVDAVGKNFPRLRIGIGPVADGISTIDFVLGSFTPEQKESREKAVIKAVKAVQCFCSSGIETAMSRFN